MDLELVGKVVLVTAGSKGIGRAVAEVAVQAGAIVVVASRSGEAPSGAHSVKFDFASDSISQLLAHVVENFGKLDGVVVNTPGPKLGPAIANSMDDWDAAYRQLLRPAIELACGASKEMEKGEGGSIVFLTSTWVKQPAVNGALSSVFRAGVAALSKQLALELAPKKVRVNQIMPGATATDRMANILSAKASANSSSVEDESAKAALEIPLGRWGNPIEIANAVIYFLSPISAFTTGASLQVDGGSTRGTL